MTGTENFDKLAPDIIASSENGENEEASKTRNGVSGLWKNPNELFFSVILWFCFNPIPLPWFQVWRKWRPRF